MEKKRLVLGCGSGRCGTSSLAAVLNAQFDACVTHEAGTPLPWFAIDRPYNINMAIIGQYPQRVVGDVSFWWLRYIGDVVKDFPGSRIVCLQRNEDDTVKSLIKCANIFGSNHYTDAQSVFYDFNKWPLEAPDAVALRSCFPKYDAPLEQAAHYFWNEYYTLASVAQQEYPDNFKIFDMDNLNTRDGVLDILRFCEFPSPIVVTVNIQKQITVG